MLSRILTGFILFSLSFYAPAMAHNGAVAIAVPVEGITIDGDLADWPGEMQWYPISITAGGAPPRDAVDLTARFKIGYHLQENALYAAVEVRDESTQIDEIHGPHWYLLDGCEIYVDAAHSQEDLLFERYAVLGEFRRMYPQQGGTLMLEDRSDIALSVQHRGQIHIYEWRINVGEQGKEGIRLEPGRSLGLEIAVLDRDADGSSSWMAWGGGIGEHGTEGWLGDVVLVDKSAETGVLTGKVQWEDTKENWSRGKVRIQSLDSRALWVVAETDQEGAYRVEIPPGKYQVEAQIGRKRRPGKEIELNRREEERVDLTVHISKGEITEAGPGKTLSGTPGKQQGVWQNFGIPDGLPHCTVRDIVQDKEGNLWFGTRGGVSRYDGKTVTTFTTADGLVNNFIYAMVQDKEGNLWFGTEDGIGRYDGETFTTFTTADGLVNNFIHSMVQDKEGNLWFGTNGGGASRYDGSRFTNFTAADGLANNKILSIFTDRKGNVWFGTWGGGVSRYDGSTFATFTAEQGLAGNFVHSIGEDHEGNLWFGTEMSGVSRYDGSVFTTFTTADGLTDNWVQSILEDSRGNLWFGTAWGGVCRLNSLDSPSFTVEEGLADSRTWSILEDREGNLWFGTEKSGVSRYNGSDFTTFTTADGLADNRVLSVLESRDGDLWFGTEVEGVSRYDGTRFTRYSVEDGLSIGEGGKRVGAILEDRNGNLWFGTENGVCRYDGVRFETFTTENGLANNEVYSILEDRRGNLWFGTDGGGVSRYDGSQFVTFTTEDGLADNWVWAIEEDSQGNLWFGTKNNGISWYDGSTFTTFTTTDGLGQTTILAIEEDRQGNLWFGTEGGGVSRYDGSSFTTFTTKEGLGSNTVWSILEDREGILWFGTVGGGVSRYDGHVFQSLLTEDGLTHNTVPGLIQSQDGTIWMATFGGVTGYRPRRTPPLISLTDVVTDRRNGPIGEIQLSSSQDYLAFEFFGQSFKTRPEAMVYRYRLNGHDDSWQTTHARRVEYQDLPVGEYTFEVQAVDRDLTYSEEPVEVEVQIHFPYERIAWMTALILALVLIFWQTRRVVQRDQKLRKANLALQQQTAGLAVTNRRLEQANRDVREATRAKSAFLANMSHELRTPMNSIINFSALILEDLYGDISDDLRDAVEEIDHNSESLLELINDLLDLSKIEAGSMELQLTECEPESCIDTALAALEHRAAEKGLRLIDEVAPDLPTLWADARRLTQHVLINLLKNAINFTSAGEIRVGARPQEGDVLFWIADTGIGIPVEEQEQIFETFHQVDGSLTRQVEGTGLGLAIARSFVELHKGRIWVESQIGKGSTFFFTIPLNRPTAVHDEEVSDGS